MTGHTVARRLVRMTPVEKALMAADLYTGVAKVVKQTVKQAARFTDANVVYVHAALRLSSTERLAVECGLRPLIVKQPEQLPLPIPAVTAVEAPAAASAEAPAPAPISLAEMWSAASDSERAMFVEEVGIDPLWEALEAAID